jgi:hypothetical protein
MRALLAVLFALSAACTASEDLPAPESPSPVPSVPVAAIPACPSGQTVHASGGCTSLVTGVPVTSCNFWCE